ncbi:S-type pyocin domain-containing protein [Vibrio sp. MEBiC08052]|uniref:S-type pyocin domain-containing protein n=1 Tax=Vibrio sp. MEBiC08052 TaxID=1761910 RepID=UPI000740CE9C|nr:S-type pyocin domain-containing protein [Vibrio sp. MEBiC08052]
MNYQTTQIYNLMRYEFAQVEGDFASLRESDVKSVMPAGMRFADFLEQLRSGHQVLLTDVPSIPLLIRDRDEWGNQYWRVNPAIEPHLDLLANKAYTARVEWVNHGIGSTYSGSVNASVYTEPYVEREPVKLTLAERLNRQRQEQLRELDKIQLPSSAWQNVFNKPPVKPSRFAKSALVPSGTCDIGTQREPLSSLGDYAAYTLAVGQGVSAASGEAFLTRIGGAALAELPGMALKIIGRAGILAAFVPNKLADSTLYSAADMRNKTTVETNIRLGFNTKGRIYGYHVNGTNIPKREVKQVGERFVVELEPEITIEWVPISGDFGGKPILVNPIPEMEKFDIWIHPQAEQGQEFDDTYITPIADADLQDYILTFPAETGLPPLYVVYKDSPRDKSGIVTGYGENVSGDWLSAAGKGLGVPIPTQIADKLRDLEFNNFDAFRKAFWLAVSEDKALMSKFSRPNQAHIKKGTAPFAIPSEQYGEIKRIQLHHVEEIQYGGAVYDIDNLRVVTPKNHNRIHYD